MDISGADQPSSGICEAQRRNKNSSWIRKASRGEFNSCLKASWIRKASLKAVVKENSRLHPGASVMFRRCTKDCKISGYAYLPMKIYTLI